MSRKKIIKIYRVTWGEASYSQDCPTKVEAIRMLRELLEVYSEVKITIIKK